MLVEVTMVMVVMIMPWLLKMTVMMGVASIY